MKIETCKGKWLVSALLLWLAFAPLAQAFYNPSTGRWLSRDPLTETGFALPHLEELNRSANSLNLQFADKKAGLEVYLFVKNDCLNFVDHLGLQICQSCPPYGHKEVRLRSCSCGAIAPAVGYEVPPPYTQGCTGQTLGSTKTPIVSGGCLRTTWGEICRSGCEENRCSIQMTYVCSMGIRFPGAYVWKFESSKMIQDCP